MSQDDWYYLAYDDRYRRMHEQGFERWVSDPVEIAGILRSIDAFLNLEDSAPAQLSIVEFGCGEGLVAEHLLSKGYQYLGVDISEVAIETAIAHIGEYSRSFFLRADIVAGMDSVPPATFDIAIDNQCFHMLITDEHRHRYLTEMNRVLRPGGRAFFRLVFQEERSDQPITDFADWLAKSGNEYEKLHNYPAWKAGECFAVRLPRVPARFNNGEGYRSELAEAGFIVEHFETDGGTCIIYAKKVT